ncbi:hypothetical protein PVAP13_7NG007900 [Panicum virgatum]|uniref:Uncharacterized protein n=1 Tax=Panicum virgatum TaxID=38727 RepID=A0A8T0PX92_PANVG|nr:hypothetical protein PVAP13_7NG007900 [Panicum virgatum]
MRCRRRHGVPPASAVAGVEGRHAPLPSAPPLLPLDSCAFSPPCALADAGRCRVPLRRRRCRGRRPAPPSPLLRFRPSPSCAGHGRFNGRRGAPIHVRAVAEGRRPDAPPRPVCDAGAPCRRRRRPFAPSPAFGGTPCEAAPRRRTQAPHRR